MKKILRSFCFVFVIITLTTCKESKVFRVGFLYPSDQRQRFVKEAEYFSQHIKELGGEAIVVGANDDEMLQLKEGFKMLEDGVDVLVISPVNGVTIGALVRRANDVGVPVVAYLRLIKNVKYNAFVTCDNFYMSQVWCEEALKKFPTGNYIIVGGDYSDKNAVEEKLGIDSFLRPHIQSGKIKIRIEINKPEMFEIKIRVPQWSGHTSILINSENEVAIPGNYSSIKRIWSANDKLEIVLDMRCRVITSPKDGKHQAILYGPIVLARDENMDNNFNENVEIISENGYVKAIKEKPFYDAVRLQFSIPTKEGNIRMIDYASCDNWNGRKICTWLPKK